MSNVFKRRNTATRTGLKYASLFDAIKEHDLNEFKAMVQSGEWNIQVDTSYVQGYLCYALQAAVLADDFDIVKFIVNHTSFPIDFTPSGSCSATTIAYVEKRGRIAQFLTQAGGDTTLVRRSFSKENIAIISGNLKELKRLRLRSENTSWTHIRACWVHIRLAIQANWFSILRYVFRRNTDESDIEFERKKQMALCLAAAGDRIKMVQWLVVTHKSDIATIAIGDMKEKCFRWLLSRPTFGQFSTSENFALWKPFERLCDSNMHLDLKRSNIGDSACLLLSKCMKHLKVKEIDLRHNERIGEVGFQRLYKALKSIPDDDDGGGGGSDDKNIKLKCLKISYLSPLWWGRFKQVGELKGIEIICPFPTLLTICLNFITKKTNNCVTKK